MLYQNEPEANYNEGVFHTPYISRNGDSLLAQCHTFFGDGGGGLLTSSVEDTVGVF